MPINGAILIACLVLAIFLFVLFYPHIENFFIFYPDKTFDSTPSEWGLVHEEVFFKTEDGKTLHGWFFSLKGERPTLLFFHGNAGNISHRLDNVKRLLEHHLQVFIFDYRGYGKSNGRPSEQGLYKDGQAAYDFLAEEKRIPPDRIVLFGRSLGAAVAVELALRKKVKAVILESAFTSTKDMAGTLFVFAPFAFLLPAHYDNLEKIQKIHVPKLIIHGDEDEIVPYRMGKKLYEKAPTPKTFFPIKAAGHNDTYVVGGDEYFRALASFSLKNF